MMKVNVGDKVSIYVSDSRSSAKRIRYVEYVVRVGVREFVAGTRRYLIRSGAHVGDDNIVAREYKNGDEELADRSFRVDKTKRLFERYERMFPEYRDEFLRSLDDKELDFLTSLYERKMARPRKDEKGS